jgi:hypothetical protein
VRPLLFVRPLWLLRLPRRSSMALQLSRDFQKGPCASPRTPRVARPRERFLSRHAGVGTSPAATRSESPSESPPPLCAEPATSQPRTGTCSDGSVAPAIQLDRVHPSIQRRLKLPPLSFSPGLPALDAANQIGCDLSSIQRPLLLPPKWKAEGLESGQSALPTHRAAGEQHEHDVQDHAPLRPQSAGVLSELREPAPPLAAKSGEVALLGLSRRFRSARRMRVPEASQFNRAPRAVSPGSEPRLCQRRLEKARAAALDA